MQGTTAIGRVLNVKHLGAGPMHTLNPFLFCVYHKDDYPAGNKQSELPDAIGDGQDFDPRNRYRMYHGEKIPGFPQHPHRGFETITATLDGTIDHSDSLGNCGRYGDGDLQWMTAGKGIVHGENFPLLKEQERNKLRLFQIWLNLPRKKKFVDPEFVMHWKEDIQRIVDEDRKSKLTLFAGTFSEALSDPGGDGEVEIKVHKSVEPTKHSWARDPVNEVAVYYVELAPGGTIDIPAASSSKVQRAVYLIEGKEVTICGKKVTRQSSLFSTFVQVSADGITTIEVSNDSEQGVELLLLQGLPIEGKGEQVVQHGPFVMNSQEQIRQTFEEYQRTKFGGWPWEEDAVIFPKEQGRFARINGEKILPPSK